MKKVLFLSLALLIAGVSFADKKCCKKDEKCKKEASACKKDEKTCSKDAKASCCKKGTAHAEAKLEEAKVEATETHACCKKNLAEGKKACCAKPAAAPAQNNNK